LPHSSLKVLLLLSGNQPIDLPRLLYRSKKL